MSKLPKSFTKVTPFTKALALSMLIIFPIIGFWLGRYYQANVPAVIQTSDPNASWKTYTNRDLGFSLNYPSNWQQDYNPNVGQVNLFGEGESTFSLSITYSQNAADKDNAGGCASVCNYTDKNLHYNWTLLKQRPGAKDNSGFIIRASNYPDTLYNREVISRILSTFKFTK